MSRPPRRRRPQRTHRWEGRVTDVERGAFGADLAPIDHEGPEVWAEFDLRHLPAAEPGLAFTVYVHRRGRRVRTVIRERNFGRWTQEEIEAARARAAKWVEDVAPTWLAAA